MSSAFDEALAVQRAAAAQGFDWNEAAGLWDKLAEEIAELREASGVAAQREELGDLLFMIANLARHLGLDPERALHEATAKFQRRYAWIEAELERLPLPGTPERLAAMEALWQAAKRAEREAPPGSGAV